MRHVNFRPLLLTIYLALLLAPPASFSQALKRNLKEYKFRQSYDLQNTITVEEANAQRAPLRGHIWEWWTTRTKGFFNVTFYSREGNPTRCKYFVEPDSSGQWRVVSECKGSVCPYTSKAKCRRYLRTTSVTTYDTLERIESGFSIDSKSPPKIPDSEDRHALKFVLILKNSLSGATDEL